MRQLDNEERLLWAKVIANVRPLRRVAPVALAHDVAEKPAVADHPPPAPVRRSERPPPIPKPAAAGGLDGGWDRRLSRGLVQPDLSIDLHGHSLATAHHLLDLRLEQALAAGARLVLLITGKPPRDDRLPVARGAIRASIDAWLHASRHASDIAAVRHAHPRHGGAGALYLVLRRRRGR